MTTTVYIPENDEILDLEDVEYAPKYIQLEKPTQKLLPTDKGEKWFDFDRLYFTKPKDRQLEGGEFGWYLQSPKIEDLSEPLWIAEAIQLIFEDDGDNREAAQLCLQEWITAFFELFQAKEDAIADTSVPERSLEMLHRASESMLQELRQLAKALGYDLSADEYQVHHFFDHLRSGFDIDPEDFKGL
jgi:hypothetical protein